MFRKVLVANRGEIALRVLNACRELGIRTVAIYAHEDRFALHRFKADESYLVGRPGEPIRSYLDIESIVALAKAHGVDAILIRQIQRTDRVAERLAHLRAVHRKESVRNHLAGSACGRFKDCSWDRLGSMRKR